MEIALIGVLLAVALVRGLVVRRQISARRSAFERTWAFAEPGPGRGIPVLDPCSECVPSAAAETCRHGRPEDLEAMGYRRIDDRRFAAERFSLWRAQDGEVVVLCPAYAPAPVRLRPQ